LLGILRANDEGIFGEISFLENSEATASVIANQDNTIVHIIEGYFLNVFFQIYPKFVPIFFRQLTIVLANRISSRELEDSEHSSDSSRTTSWSNLSNASSSLSSSQQSPSRDVKHNRKNNSRKSLVSTETRLSSVEGDDHLDVDDDDFDDSESESSDSSETPKSQPLSPVQILRRKRNKKFATKSDDGYTITRRSLRVHKREESKRVTDAAESIDDELVPVDNDSTTGTPGKTSDSSSSNA